MKIVLIIPTYNENLDTLKAIVKNANKIVDKIIVIDDGSKNKVKLECQVLRNKINRGKGYSVRKALNKIRKFDIIFFMDADGEHDLNDINNFINKFKKGYNGLIMGERKKHRSLKRKIINSWMNFWLNLVIKGKDFSCGFRAIDNNSLQKLDLKSDRFEIDLEMVLESVLNKINVSFVKINHNYINKTHIKFKDYIRMNNYFDKWVLNNYKNLRIGFFKKVFLFFFCRLGLIISYLLVKLTAIKNLVARNFAFDHFFP